MTELDTLVCEYTHTSTRHDSHDWYELLPDGNTRGPHHCDGYDPHVDGQPLPLPTDREAWHLDRDTWSTRRYHNMQIDEVSGGLYSIHIDRPFPMYGVTDGRRYGSFARAVAGLEELRLLDVGMRQIEVSN